MKSIFEESADLFGTPARILIFIGKQLDHSFPSKSSLTWEELGSVLVEYSEGKEELNVLTRPSTPPGGLKCAWERLREEKNDDFLRLKKQFPSLVGYPAEKQGGCIGIKSMKLWEICVTISKELGLCVIFQKQKLDFDSHVLSLFTSFQASEWVLSKTQVNQYPLQRFLYAFDENIHIHPDEVSLFSAEYRGSVRERIPASWANHSDMSAEMHASNCVNESLLGLLDSDKCSELVVAFSTGLEPEQQRQRALLMNAHRVVSRPVGRGALTLFSMSYGVKDTVASPINLNGKFNSVGIVSIDLSLFPIDALFWPEFHNGFASSVSFIPSPILREEIIRMKNFAISLASGKRKIFGVPSELLPLALHRHAGFLFGLLLLRSTVLSLSSPLRLDDMYNYLRLQNESLSVAVILGVSMGARNSQDEKLSKICLLHIPSQIPADDLEISPSVTSAALAALGFLFSSSLNRSILQILLKEMVKKPIGDKPSVILHRESLVFSAGLAVGLIALAKGPQASCDIKLADTLLGMTFLGAAQRDRDIDSTSVTNNSSARVSLLQESSDSNCAVSLPGACIALALSYLNTSDRVVCDRIKVPGTIEELELLEPRSDSIFFKILAKCVIMMDLIEPCVQWVEAQLPGFLRDPGSLESKETRLPGSDDCPSLIDWAAVYQARMYAIAGVSVAMGIKYAGSKNNGAKLTLIKILKSFINSTQWPKVHCAAQSASRPSPALALDRSTVETCRAAALLALACVMAGTGDTDCLEFAKKLKDSSDEATPYGINLAINQAMGFIFLGNGKLTFSNSPLALACLLISILPRYPLSVSDNRASLQALRHLYVVAAENRCVEAFDLTAMQITSQVPAKIISADLSETGTKLPATLPRKSDFHQLVINSDRFEPITITDPKERILLKRIPGKSSHESDPFGSRNADRAYISEFSEPTDSEVRKLLGLPLGAPDENNLDWIAYQEGLVAPTSRTDWRPTPAELAAVSWPRKNLGNKYREIIANKELMANIEPFSVSLTEKYSELLLPDAEKSDMSRPELIRLLDKSVKDQTLDIYLDLFEARNS